MIEKLEPIPTRPSEDDMMSQPKQPIAPINSPDQYRDVGLRVDRYGSIVLRPELANDQNRS